MKAICSSLTSLVLLVASTAAFAGKVYWSDRLAGKVERANLDGTDVETLVTIDSTNLRGLSIDIAGSKLYIADNQTDKIYRADLDGGVPEELVSGLIFPADVKLDPTHQKLYWCDQGRSRIQRSNLDGSNVEVILETPKPYYLDLDLPNNQLYWGGFSNGTINRVNLDGTGMTTLVSNIGLTRGVKLDTIKGYLYWCDRQGNVVQRRKIGDNATPLPSAEVEDIVTGLDTPHGLVLDPIARKAYWYDTGTDGHGVGGQAVNRADMDLPGSPIETIAALNQPWDGDLDLRTTSYADWDARYFLIARSASETDPQADLDSDGVHHLLEYALVGHPERREDQALYEIVTTEDAQGQTMPAFRFQRFSNADDLNYQLETSADLVTWQFNDGTTTVTSPPLIETLDFGVERVTIAATTTSAKYMRLRVTLKL